MLLDSVQTFRAVLWVCLLACKLESMQGRYLCCAILEFQGNSSFVKHYWMHLLHSRRGTYQTADEELHQI